MLRRLKTTAAIFSWIVLIGCGTAQSQKTEELFDQAERLVKRGQWARSISALEKVVVADPKDAEATRYLAWAYEATGDYAKLIELAQRRTADDVNDTSWFVAWIDALRIVGRDPEAQKAIEERLKARGDDFLVESILGDIHFRHGRLREAEEIFTRLVVRAQKVVVDSPPDLVGLGRAYRFFRDGRPNPADQAESVLFEAKKKDKNFMRAYEELALVYAYMKDRWADVKKTYATALELRPRWPKYLMGYVLANEIRLQFDEGEAREKLDEALAINPRFPDALVEKGLRELSDALWDSAKKRFDAALEVNPSHIDALAGLAAWGYLTKDMAQFEVYEKRVLALHPSYGRLYQLTAGVLNERRRWPESLEFMRKATALEPDNPRLWDDLARYALYLGHEDEGKKALETADRLSPYGRVWRTNMYLVREKIEKFDENKTDRLVVRMPKTESKILGPLIVPFLEKSFDEFKERYEFTPTLPVLVEVFPKHDDFAVRTMGTQGLGALGVCFGPTIFMDSPRAQKEGTYNWRSTAHHELAHVFTLQLSKGRTPRWLTEGLSTWEEVRRSPSWGRHMENDLLDAYANDKIFDVVGFDAGFHGPRIIFAYYQGGLVCEWLEKTYGVKKIREMLVLYGDDKQTPQVLKEALGISPERFDREFKEFVAKKLEKVRRIPNWDQDSMTRFKAEIEAKKDVQENRIKLAWAHRQRGNAFDADTVLKELLDSGATDWRIDFLQGVRALEGKAKDVAAKHFASAVEKGGVDSTLFFALAKNAEETRDTKAAIEFYKKSDECHPYEPNPNRSPKIQLARLAKAAGDMESYYRRLEEYIELADTAVDLRWELYKAQMGRKNVDAALLLLEEIRCVTPYDREIYVEEAKIFAEQKKFVEAAQALEIILDLGVEGKKEEVDVRLRLARALAVIGKKDDAIYQYERVLDMDPENSAAKDELMKLEQK